MRDLVLVACLPILIYVSLRRPFIAVSLWLWSSAVNLNQLVYGFAVSIPFAKVFAGATIVSFFISKEKYPIKFELITFLIIIFYSIATISNIFAIGNQDTAWMRWELFTKIILFYFFANAIITKKIHFDLLIWVLVISIGAMAAKEGAKFLVSGGGHRIPHIAGISGDNNFFGVMILTVIPLACYLYTQAETMLIKQGLLVLVMLMILGIFSTFSRGAFLGLLVLAISFWKSSEKKLLWLLLMLLIASVLANLMPEEWLARMDTVENADEDSSFMGRVIAWKVATLIAMDNFWGGGFRAVENIEVWYEYSLQFYKLSFIPTETLAYFKATHSVYFQVLSNHGFIGLIIFLLMLLFTYTKITKITKITRKEGLDNWIIVLSKMLRLSLISYCVSGAAVNLAYFDFLYAIFAMVVALYATVLTQIDNKKML